MPSKWLIHTVWSVGWSASRPPGRLGDRSGVRPYSPWPPRADLAAELLGDELGAVADAEDGHAQLVDLRVEQRGAVDVDRLGAARQDQRRRGPRPEPRRR